MSGSTFQPPINLDPNQDSSQQTAFINQNFQSLASSLNPYIVSDGTNNRIILGKQNDGTYGMKVSQAGVDVGTATNAQLIFNSNQDIFKVVKSGTTTLTNSGTNPTNITIAHNLGLIPAFLVYIQIPSAFSSTAFAGKYVNTPMVVPDNTGATAVILSPSVDTTNLYISQRDIYSSGGSPNTYNIKYYLFQETAN